MNDKKLSLSISVSSAAAWMTWTVMTILLCVAAGTRDLLWASFALALSAVAATLHIRCFLIRLHSHLRAAYEMGREDERVTQLRSAR